MAKVTEHEPKEERESNDRDDSGVGLLVARDAIRVCNLLEYVTKLVWLEVGGPPDIVVVVWLYLGSTLLVLNLADNVLLIFNWRPEKPNKSVVLGFHSVQILIESLLLGQEHLVDVQRRLV